MSRYRVMCIIPRRVTLAFASCWLFASALLSAQVIGVPPFGPAIAPIDAIHLVEMKLPRFGATEIRAGREHGRATFEVHGAVGDKPVVAIVDASAARVLEIQEDGKPTYKWEGIIAVGHRGTVKFAPENTMAAFNKAIELGADLLEMDIRETKDGELVIMHDPTVNRTTDGKGAISQMTLAEIKALDAGAKFNEKFKGERVPTFKEVLDGIRGRALPDLHFKAGDPAKVIKAVKEADLLGKVTLACDDIPLLKKTMEMEGSFLNRPTAYTGRRALQGLLTEFNPPIINIDWRQFSEPLVQDAHLAGKRAFANTMGPSDNEFGIRACIDAGADYIQTDNLDILLPLLRARGLHK